MSVVIYQVNKAYSRIDQIKGLYKTARLSREK
jgi:hypothetical protein